MERTRRIATAARRRVFATDLLDRLGRYLCAGTAVGLGLVVAERVIGLGAGFVDAIPTIGAPAGPWVVLLGGPLTIATVAAGAVTALHRRSLLGAAARVDQSLQLKDRLSSALAFDRGPTGERVPGGVEVDPFVQIAIDDAEQTAARVNVRKAVPLTLTRAWWTWPTIGLAAVLCGTVLPGWHLLTSKAETRVAEAALDREDAKERLAEAIETIKPDADGEQATASAAASKRIEAIEQLQQELESGIKPPDEVRAEGARSMEEVAADLEQRAEDERSADETLRERLARLAAEGSQGESELTRAIREGDLSAAREAANSLLSKAPDLSQEEREKLASELEQLAKQLDPEGSEPPAAEGGEAAMEASGPDSAPGSADTPGAPDGGDPPAAGAHAPKAGEPGSSSLREDLRNQGLNDRQIDEIAKEKEADAARERLEKEGVDPEAAQRLSERIAEEAKERDAAEKADQKAKELSEGLQGAADSLRNTEREPEKEANPSKPGEQNDADKGKEDSEKGRRGEGASGQDGDKSGADAKARDRENKEGEEGEKRGQGGKEKGHSGKDGQAEGESGEKSADGQGERQRVDGEKPGAEGVGTPSDEGKGKQAEGRSDKPGESGEGQKEDGAKPSGGEKGENGDRTGEKPGGQNPDSGRKPETKPDPGAAEGGKSRTKDKPAGEGQKGTEPGGAAEQPEAKGEKPGGSESGEKPDGGSPGETDKGKGKPEPDAKGDSKDALSDPGGKGSESGGTPDGKPGEGGGNKSDTKGGAGGKEAKPDPSKTGGSGPTEGGDAAGSGGEAGEGENDGLKELSKTLDNLERQRGAAEDDAKKAEEIRQKAKELLEDLSPEERERIRQWAVQMAREQAAPPPTGIDIVDARPRERFTGERSENERVVAEWLGQGKAGSEGSEGAPGAEAAQVLRKAAESAERAIDDRALPTRYDDLLRRYFRRLPERVLPKDAPKVAPAKDAAPPTPPTPGAAASN